MVKNFSICFVSLLTEPKFFLKPFFTYIVEYYLFPSLKKCKRNNLFFNATDIYSIPYSWGTSMLE